ncbi:MAG: Gx transporter family protein [Oscillospiraceae bacterium]|nr:Gx transporter family protein [Oscillospiraceae bacterium]
MKALKVRKVALCALFICIAAVLSAVESWLPPICAIPGVRVGLGNIVTMFMLYIGGKWKSADALIVVILRCFVAAFVTGAVMNVFYGVMGGVCSLGVMLLMRKILPGKERENWLPLVGVAGATAHIIGQMLTAVIIYGNLMVLAYTPILLASAIIGGAFTGICTLLLLKKINRHVLDDIRMNDIPTVRNDKTPEI